ncbi:hypothetical protein CTEN210_15258 [Chaetoceros tenuissimus]|uniref:TRIP4/RQT4 C2HC5-type zinc finger domain-containing protein n=1 Tax=Chaetoceros tenuissimus TaxID=426638 RepID=A0AAD3D6E5_9STRA|nr:hypothetical protein CTEN210_15258 [Chaetoceros tenuissimus]
MSDNKVRLKNQLAVLLSFDYDDVDDIFEPLMDFDSEEDLVEYLSALLGEETEELSNFVTNLIRFQKGEALELDVNTSSTSAVKTQKNTPVTKGQKETELPPSIPTKSKKQKDAMKIEEEKKGKRRAEELKRKKDEESRLALLDAQKKEQERALQEYKQRQDEEKKSLELAKSMTDLSISEKKISKEDAAKSPAVQPTKNQGTKRKEYSKPRKPKIGKAKVVCGCFGNVHEALTNCLHCGRISCEKEGYDYCPYCSHLIEEIVSVDNGEELTKAILHKERLLKFDRESTKRTVVYDDQADYFNNSSSTWLTESEQHDARMKEEQRQRDLHTIRKHVLNIQF